MMEVKVCGKIIGNAESWDELSESEVIWYDFQPDWDKLQVARGYSLSFNWETGTFTVYDNEEGDVIATLRINWDIR
jgi:hypothetical protein